MSKDECKIIDFCNIKGSYGGREWNKMHDKGEACKKKTTMWRSAQCGEFFNVKNGRLYLGKDLVYRNPKGFTCLYKTKTEHNFEKECFPRLQWLSEQLKPFKVKDTDTGKFIRLCKRIGEDTKVLEKLKELSSVISWKKIRSMKEYKSSISYDFGVEHGNLITNGIISHNSLAVHATKSGMALRKVQMLLGHSNIDTTAQYLQFSPSEVKEEYDKLWSD